MKTKVSKFILFLSIIAILFSVTFIVVSADESVVTSGTCGENLVWNYESETGALTISGSGNMHEYSTHSDIPWAHLRKEIKAAVISDGVTSISSRAFSSCSGISEIIIGNDVESIGDYAFNYCPEVTSLIIPGKVKTIGICAFGDLTSLTDLTISDGVKSIGDGAFGCCYSLTEITFPDSVSDIGIQALYECENLKEVNIGSGLESLNCTIFMDCMNLESVNISSQNPYLSDDGNGVVYNKDKTVLLFYPASKADTSYTIPDSVTSIYPGAFNFALNLTKISVSDNLTSIGSNAFYACFNLEDFSLPQSVTTIGDHAFAGCKISNITLPECLTTLGYGVFYSCENLLSAYIPVSITNIDSQVFRYCNSLTDVYYGGNEEEWSAVTIGNYNESLEEAEIHFNHTHSYTKTVETEPSCKEKGLESFNCSCGHNYTKAIPKTAHAEADWEYKSGSVFVKICSECSEEYKSITAEISLDKNEIQLARTETAALKASVTDGITADINFESANKNIADVDSEGNITAVGTGETVISASINGTEIIAVCDIIVTPARFNTVWIIDGQQTTFTVEEEAKIIIPDAPQKEGFIFTGWSPEVPEVMPSHDLEFTAVFDCVIKSDEYDVSATYSPECFSQKVIFDVSEVTGNREPGGVYMVDGKTYVQVGTFSLKTTDENGEVVQPNEGCKVKIKMAIPEEYKDRTDMVIYHRFVDGGREQLSTAEGTLVIENGYMIFEVSKFSEFEILARAAAMTVSKLPDKSAYRYKENLDLSGIELKITDIDGTVEYVTDTAEMTVKNFDSSKTGTQTVTVMYKQYSCMFEVSVNYTWWQWIIRILFLGFIWY